MRQRRTIRLVAAVILAVLLFSFWFFKLERHYLDFQPELVPDNFWGVTFSTKYADELGVSPREAFVMMLDDLHVSKVRLPLYWDEIEKEDDLFDFSEYDWYIEVAGEYGVDLVLTLGRRAPRWPECHAPEWVSVLPADRVQSEELELIEMIVERYKDSSAVVAWQVQNEFFVQWFGICPPGQERDLVEQISLVRQLDDRPIILTDSGEFSFWTQVSRYADIVGTTMYRVAWNKVFGHIYSAWPAWYYSGKATLNNTPHSSMIVAELQAEPWPADFKHVRDISRSQVDESFPLEQLYTNAELARRTGFAEAYFWGVEWWYWMKEQGYPEYWEAAAEIIKQSDAG